MYQRFPARSRASWDVWKMFVAGANPIFLMQIQLNRVSEARIIRSARTCWVGLHAFIWFGIGKDCKLRAVQS